MEYKPAGRESSLQLISAGGAVTAGKGASKGLPLRPRVARRVAWARKAAGKDVRLLCVAVRVAREVPNAGTSPVKQFESAWTVNNSG